MSETEVFASEAADVAMEAVKNGVARIEDYDWQTVYDKALKSIKEARDTIELLQKNDFIHTPDPKLLDDALQKAIDAVK